MYSKKHLLVVLIIMLGLLPLIAQEEQTQPGDDDDSMGVYEENDDEIVIKFAKEAQLEYFIRLVAKQTRKIFIYDPAQVSNLKVYILADKIRIKKSALYALLLALLEHQKLTITHYGENSDDTVEIYKIELIAEALNKQNFEDGDINNLKERAQIASMIVHLQYAEPNSVARAVQSLTKKDFIVQAIMSTGLNAVIISGMEYQIKNVSKMIAMLDKPGPKLELAVIPVQYADVTELSTKLNSLVRSALMYQNQFNRGRTNSSSSDNTMSLEADERTNSIIVQATEENISLVRQLLKRLDIAMPEEDASKIQIYFCKHTTAEELATTLNSLNLSALFEEARTSSSGATVDPWGRVIYYDNRNRNNPNQQTEQEIKIASDERTNSLIITARPDDYLEIKRLIDNLDTRKPQVMIEAAIIEVSADHNLEFGFELTDVSHPKEGETRAFAATNYGFSDIVDENGVPISSGGGIPAGKLPRYGEGTTFGLWQNDYFSIPLLLRAVQTDTDANILSRPKILTNDNEEATIKISNQEPTVTSSTTTTSENTSFSYEEAGIVFKVTPHISEQNYLRLKIDLDVDSFTAKSAGAPADAPPPKTTRKITTTVTIPDQQTIVIGGLTSTRASKVVKKVPILGDIPLLGELFKAHDNEEKRSNLYIFIRPVILRDSNFSDLHKISKDEIKRAEEETIDTEESLRFFKAANEDAKLFELDEVGKTMRRFKYVSVRKTIKQDLEEREEEKERLKKKYDR